MEKPQLLEIEMPGKQKLVVDFDAMLLHPELQSSGLGDIIRDTLVELSQNGDLLGQGKSADVFSLKNRPLACVKIIHTREPATNAPGMELSLTDMANKKGVMAPRMFCSVTLVEAGQDLIIMETITGKSIRWYLESTTPFPESFDVRAFLDRLEGEVKTLHNNRLYHRDLHDGNVMITDSGTPAIIDFGSAIHQPIGSENPYREIRGGKVLTFTDDLDNISQLRKKMIQHVLKHKKEE